MRLILIGPPGSGKGTQAELLSERLALRHLSTGDILREAIAAGTPEGKLAGPYISAGRLVPDELVNEIIRIRFQAKDRPNGFVMDGYPRTMPQAIAFESMLFAAGLKVDAAISLDVADDEIVRRLSGRRICPNAACARTYHTTTKPPKLDGICDQCGTALAQRDDDKPETIRNRLQIFHSRYDDLVEYYRTRGLLLVVPGLGDVETIYRNITRALKLT